MAAFILLWVRTRSWLRRSGKDLASPDVAVRHPSTRGRAPVRLHPGAPPEFFQSQCVPPTGRFALGGPLDVRCRRSSFIRHRDRGRRWARGRDADRELTDPDAVAARRPIGCNLRRRAGSGQTASGRIWARKGPGGALNDHRWRFAMPPKCKNILRSWCFCGAFRRFMVRRQIVPPGAMLTPVERASDR